MPTSPWIASKTPTMIIMIAANKMNPTAAPLGSSARRADRYPGVSVICPSLLRLLLRAASGGPACRVERTVAPCPVAVITHFR
jgi:hypothetical protein